MTPKDSLWATKIMELPTSEMDKFYVERLGFKNKWGGVVSIKYEAVIL